MGVVVAGGASTRFGSDKALARFDGETLLGRALGKLAAICDGVVVADAGRGLYDGVESVPDGPGHGPAAAILGAALRRPERALLVLACDLPRVPEALLARIATAAGDWVVPRGDGKLEPLCALYRPRAISALAEQVARGDFALHRLAVASLVVRYLDAEEIADLGDPGAIFTNVNTAEDLERLRRG